MLRHRAQVGHHVHLQARIGGARAALRALRGRGAPRRSRSPAASARRRARSARGPAHCVRRPARRWRRRPRRSPRRPRSRRRPRRCARSSAAAWTPAIGDGCVERAQRLLVQQPRLGAPPEFVERARLVDQRADGWVSRRRIDAGEDAPRERRRNLQATMAREPAGGWRVEGREHRWGAREGADGAASRTPHHRPPLPSVWPEPRA